MTTLHLQTEIGYQTASMLKQNATAMLDEAQSLRRALQNLEAAWQGGAQMEFTAEASALMNQMQNQINALQILAERLEREVTEWEETDARGAAALRTASLRLVHAMPIGGIPISAGGMAGMPFLGSVILPLFTGLSVAQLLGGIPKWLDAFLDRFFPPAPVISPLPDEVEGWRTAAPRPPATSFGDLLREPSPATPSAQPAAPPPEPPAQNTFDVYYDVPVKSQGDLYGNAACAPTAASMVMDYYHAQDASNQTVSPQQLIGMLDKGDGTPGTGMSLSNITDELNSLGYDHISQSVNASLQDLRTELQSSPVIVTTGVQLAGSAQIPRAITGPGSTIHAMVVKGVSEAGVAVNDPWSGREMEIPMAIFSQMWDNGSNGMYVIRP